jgi:hypothetical protein
MLAEQTVSERKLRLGCSVQLKRTDEAINCNSSVTGLEPKAERLVFHYLSAEPFLPGEYLRCEISIPTQDGTEGESLILSCQVKVLRVEVTALEPGFGITFQFQSGEVAFRLTTPPEKHLWTWSISCAAKARPSLSASGRSDSMTRTMDPPGFA